jgi:hypothetical protein
MRLIIEATLIKNNPVLVEEYVSFRPVRLAACTTRLPTRFTETTTFSLRCSPIIPRHRFGSLVTHQDESKAVWHRFNHVAPSNQIPPINKRKLANIPNEFD